MSYQRTPSRRTTLLGCITGGFGLSMGAQTLFLVPLRARELGASFDAIGVIIGSGALASALLALASGLLIDRLGSKRSFVLGTSSTVVVSLLFVVPDNYWWFVVLLPCAGVARNLGWVASQAYVTGLGSAEDAPRLAGRFSFFVNVGQMVGPLLAGAGSQLLGFRWGFLVPAAYAASFSLLGLVAVEGRGARPKQRAGKPGAGLRSAIEIAAIRGIQFTILVTFVRLWINYVYSTFFPVHLVDAGLAPGVVGTVMATSGLVAALMAPTAGFWARRFSDQAVVLTGLACGAGGLLVAPHVSTLPAAYLVPVLVGVGGGLSLPILLGIVSRAAPLGKRGVAFALRGFANQVASTSAPVTIGPLITVVGLTLGFTAGGVVAASVLLGAWALGAEERSPPAT